jgi:hypothetical protein
MGYVGVSSDRREWGHYLEMAEPEEVLVELLDEGVRVWAPVAAQKLPDGL